MRERPALDPKSSRARILELEEENTRLRARIRELENDLAWAQDPIPPVGYW